MNMKQKDRLRGRKTLEVGDVLEEFEKDDIRRRVDIVDLFEYFGVVLSKKGKGYMGLCPWHKDSKTPSLSVDREKGLYNCFGCGESGDVFTLAGKMKGIDFRESVTWLKEFSNLTPSRPRRVEKGNSKPEEKPEGKGEVGTRDGGPPGDALTLNTVSDYYHKRLPDNPRALEYLRGRGLDDNRLISRFKIGFADGTLLEKISDKQKETLTLKGIITDKGREHFGNCITFPIVDPSTGLGDREAGQVVGIYGRSINGTSKVPHLYLKGNHKGIFNHKASSVYDEIILTECIIDALSLIALGIENVQPLYGINGFTDEHLKLLKDNRVKTVILAFDNDEAGKKAADRMSEKLLSEGFSVKVIRPVAGKDWNGFLTTGGDKAQVLELIAHAEVTEAKKGTGVPTGGFDVSDDAFGYGFTFPSAGPGGEVSYRVSGVKDLFLNTLKVAIRAGMNENAYYDTADLYSSRSRDNFSRSMSKHFDIEPARVEKHLVAMLEYLEGIRDRKLAGNQEEERVVTREEVELGMELLTDPALFERIVEDMEVLGYVGEEINKKLIYLAASSRKLDDPISVMIISQSAAGKSMLVDTVKELIPPEDVIEATSLSDQALNYVDDLEHKFLVLSEAVHNEVVEHQLREMLSAKKLSRLVALKDPKTGRMSTKLVSRRALVSLVMSSTRHEVNPENASRSFVLDSDESREQTRRIHAKQQKKYSLQRYRERSEEKPGVIRRHHAAQRLLRGRIIVNPYGDRLSFPDTLMRARRDHERFQDLIACVCYLRQFQKTVRQAEGVEFIECDIEDYRIAYDIMVTGVLSATLRELPGSAFELYDLVRTMVRKRARTENIEVEQVRFTQRELREFTGLNHTHIKRTVRLLAEYEYIVKERGSERTRSFYRLRGDEDISSLDFSVIPAPEEIEGGEK